MKSRRDGVRNSESEGSGGEPVVELKEENQDDDNPEEDALELCIGAAYRVGAPYLCIIDPAGNVRRGIIPCVVVPRRCIR